MTTNVIRRALADFNARILDDLNIPGEEFDLLHITARFARNPFQPRKTPIILLPRDVLRKLPIARDWDSAQDAAFENESLRHRVNTHIGEIWKSQSKRKRKRLEEEALASAAAFQTLLDCIHAVPKKPYDSDADPDGIVTWSRVAHEFAARYPFTFTREPGPPSLQALYDVVREIVRQFTHLVENCGLNKDLYHQRKPRHESTVQRLFFTVAYAYCRANDIDVSPEIDTGSGTVDFKFSTGFDARVLVETKLSTNPKVLHGYETQLEVYRTAQETTRAVFLVIDVGRMGRKDEELTKAKNAAAAAGHPVSDLDFVDGTLKKPASKR